MVDDQRVPHPSTIRIDAQMVIATGEPDVFIEIVWDLGLFPFLEMDGKGNGIPRSLALPTGVLEEKHMWGTAEESCKPQPSWISFKCPGRGFDRRLSW